MFLDYLVPSVNLPGRLRTEPLALLAEFAGVGVPQLQAEGILKLLVFSLGALALARVSLGNTRRAAALAAAATVLAISPFSMSPVPLAVHWWPWLCLTPRIPNTPARLVAVALVSAVFVWSGGPVAPVGLLLFALVRFATRDRQTRRPTAGEIIILGAALTLAVVTIPVPEFPQLPPGARLAPISPFTLQGEPYLGPWLSPNPIVWEGYLHHLRHALALYSASLLLFILAVPPFVRRNTPARKAELLAHGEEENAGRDAVYLLLFPVVCIGLDAILPVQWLPYSPWQSVVRLVPGVALFELPLILAPMCYLAALAALPTRVLPKGKSATGDVRSLVLVALAAVLAGVEWYFAPSHPVPPATLESTVGLSPQTYPFNFLYSEYGAWIASPHCERHASPSTMWHEGSDVVTRLSSSVAQNSIHHVRDGNLGTAWTTGEPQQPGQWLQLEFDRPLPVRAVTLHPGKFPADFPRGVSVEVSSEDEPDFKPVFLNRDWLGPLYWTSDGYPYLAGQEDVTIPLRLERPVSKLRITQTGAGVPFNWTIAEVILWKQLPCTGAKDLTEETVGKP